MSIILASILNFEIHRNRLLPQPRPSSRFNLARRNVVKVDESLQGNLGVIESRIAHTEAEFVPRFNPSAVEMSVVHVQFFIVVDLRYECGRVIRCSVLSKVLGK